MNTKRDALERLGWNKELIDSFLHEDAADLPAFDSPETFVLQAYSDQSNVTVDLPTASIQSGVSVTSRKPRKASATKRP
jgi:hypothetical protein